MEGRLKSNKYGIIKTILQSCYFCRKMMNRVAAQSARDRKKSYIDDLEKKVAILEQQNRQLQAENQNLKQETTVLTSEKNQLELCLADSIQTDIVTGLVKRESPKETPFRSAAPGVVSLQQKHFPRANLLPVWMMLRYVFHTLRSYTLVLSYKAHVFTLGNKCFG